MCIRGNRVIGKRNVVSGKNRSGKQLNNIKISIFDLGIKTKNQ
jgi:hypothetical protein